MPRKRASTLGCSPSNNCRACMMAAPPAGGDAAPGGGDIAAREPELAAAGEADAEASMAACGWAPRPGHPRLPS